MDFLIINSACKLTHLPKQLLMEFKASKQKFKQPSKQMPKQLPKQPPKQLPKPTYL